MGTAVSSVHVRLAVVTLGRELTHYFPFACQCLEFGISGSLVPRPSRVRRLQYEIIISYHTASDERAKAWERGYISGLAGLENKVH